MKLILFFFIASFFIPNLAIQKIRTKLLKKASPNDFLRKINYENGPFPRTYEEQEKVFEEKGNTGDFCDAFSRLPVACINDSKCGWCSSLRSCVYGDVFKPTKKPCPIRESYVYNVPRIFCFEF